MGKAIRTGTEEEQINESNLADEKRKAFEEGNRDDSAKPGDEHPDPPGKGGSNIATNTKKSQDALLNNQ